MTANRSRALGAVSAQAAQALGSFTLGVLTARLLGLEGLGRFAVLYGLLILATAVCSGFVGDSLTVLDRSTRPIRAGVQLWLALLSLSAGLLAWLGSWGVRFVDLSTALAFGGATTVFIVEDALRRTLMAAMKFWRIVLVDLVGIAAAVSFILAFGSPSIGTIMSGLLVGQASALIVAVAVLPRAERWLARPWPAAISTIAAYGVWRALQQSLRPALLAGVRLVCSVVVGITATGELEVARIYMAPALLVGGGTSHRAEN